MRKICGRDFIYFLRRGSQTRQGGDGDEDCASITTIDPHVKQWMVAVSRGDYQSAAKMLIDDPKLSRCCQKELILSDLDLNPDIEISHADIPACTGRANMEI